MNPNFRPTRGGSYQARSVRPRSSSTSYARGWGRGSSRSCSLGRNLNPPSGAPHRMFPIGIKKMEELLERDAYIISEELLKKNSGYQIFLDEEELKPYKLGLVLKLLQKATSSRAYSEGVAELLLLTFQSMTFRQNLTSFISEIKEDTESALEYLPLIAEILSEFTKRTPSNAYKIASQLTDMCIGVIYHLQSENVSVDDILHTFENLKLCIKESKVEFAKATTKNKVLQPPDNYKHLEVLPTPYELTATEPPFIRPLVVEGGYQDSNHYLDVHFRLLKEDFVRPLRQGINYYLSGGDYKKSDVRVYFNVEFDSVQIEKSNIVFYLKLNLRNQFRIENTKRLIYGNILCLSYDNFETMVIASVSNRDKLSNKLLGVKLESEPFTLDHKQKYTLIESKAYFVSYKYTLEALKKFDQVPLQSYIVASEEKYTEPLYVKHNTMYQIDYDLKPPPIYNLFSPREEMSIFLLDDIRNWPTCGDLGLDESQRRAFHAALTRQMAIIQGPPGTGKTYLGLKVTQVLLHNKNIWRTNSRKSILVVCYTNHALDQFLEGMLSFTSNMVRIGSQSKNEILQRYQINKRLTARRTDDGTVLDKRYRELRHETLALKENIERMSEKLILLNIPCIISAQAFQKNGLIPCNISSMKHWLFDSLYDPHSMDSVENEISNIQVSSEPKTEDNSTNGEANNENSMKNELINEELMKEEEYGRTLDDDDDDEVDEEISRTADLRLADCLGYLPLERTLKEIIEEVSQIEEQINPFNPYDKNNRQFYQQIKKLNSEFRTINTGCKLTLINCQKLEQVEDIWSLNLIERWQLYMLWKEKLKLIYQKFKLKLENSYRKNGDRLQKLKDLKYFEIMKEADIIGMTTTGAAQYNHLLHDLAPPIGKG